MSFLTGAERANTIWGRLILVVFFGSYILASIAQKSLMPVGLGLMLLLAFGLVY